MCSRLQPPCVQVIQRVLRSRFPASTILTIAHRLDTVIDYDHLLLMAEGRVAEARQTNMMCGVHVRLHVRVHVWCTYSRPYCSPAARQAVHITCDVAAYLSRRVTQQSCSHGPTRSSRPSSAAARPRSGCMPSPRRQRAGGSVCSRQAVR